MSPDLQWILGFAGKYPSLDIVAIFFADYVPYIVLIVFVITVLLQQDMRRRLYIILFSGLSLILASGIIRSALMYFFYRPRPFVEYSITPLIDQAATASFPSGHATLFFTIATLTFICLSRRWGVWAYVMATLIGAARVYAGVHYPLDILGGAVLGILSPILVRNLLPKPMVRATTPAEPEPTA